MSTPSPEQQLAALLELGLKNAAKDGMRVGFFSGAAVVCALAERGQLEMLRTEEAAMHAAERVAGLVTEGVPLDDIIDTIVRELTQ